MKKRDVKVYAEGGGSGPGSSDLQSELRQGFAEFFAKTDLGKVHRPRVVACGGREQALDMFRTAVKHGENALLLVDSENKVAAADLEHVLNDVHGIGQMGQHETGEGQIVQSGQGFGQPLVIAGQAAEPSRPAEAAFDHPAPG